MNSIRLFLPIVNNRLKLNHELSYDSSIRSMNFLKELFTSIQGRSDPLSLSPYWLITRPIPTPLALSTNLILGSCS